MTLRDSQRRVLRVVRSREQERRAWERKQIWLLQSSIIQEVWNGPTRNQRRIDWLLVQLQAMTDAARDDRSRAGVSIEMPDGEALRRSA